MEKSASSSIYVTQGPISCCEAIGRKKEKERRKQKRYKEARKTKQKNEEREKKKTNDKLKK